MRINTAIEPGVGLRPITTPPTSIRLRGACGPGFGRGQMLARVHLTDPKAKMVVERSFLPCTIAKNFTTHPFAWQTRPFAPEVTDFKNWTYVILEVAIDSVTPAVFQIENLDGSFVQPHWTKLDLSSMLLDEETGCQLAMLTGLQYRKRKFPAPKNYWKNFPEADRVDIDHNRPRPRRVENEAPQAPRAVTPKRDTKVTIDKGDNDVGILAFMVKTLKDAKADIRVIPDGVAPKLPAAPRPQQQHKPDAQPKRQPQQPYRNSIDLVWPTKS